MPFLEERRQEVLHQLDGQLREWQTHFKDIVDPRDLELSHLLKQVRLYRLRLPAPLADALPLLKEMRDALAHLEVVASTVLDDPAILKIEHGVYSPYRPPSL